MVSDYFGSCGFGIFSFVSLKNTGFYRPVFFIVVRVYLLFYFHAFAESGFLRK